MEKTTKILISIIVVLAIGLITILTLRFSTSEDAWLCQNGNWTKHGNPNTPQPTTACGVPSGTISYDDLIYITGLQQNQLVTSPLTIAGKARGSWYFEAQFPITVYDAIGTVIGSGTAQAQGDWQTNDYVPFTANVTFSTASIPLSSEPKGTIVVQNDNPSGLLENAKSISIPVRFQPPQTTSVKIFFNNTEKDPDLVDCSNVYSVNRTIPQTIAVGRAALEQLFKGLSKEEAYQGFFDNIPAGVKIQSLTIENGVAKVDLSKELEQGVGGSCRVTAIRAQITETLKQFPTVKEVTISIDGRTEDILQP